MGRPSEWSNARVGTLDVKQGRPRSGGRTSSGQRLAEVEESATEQLQRRALAARLDEEAEERADRREERRQDRELRMREREARLKRTEAEIAGNGGTQSEGAAIARVLELASAERERLLAMVESARIAQMQTMTEGLNRSLAAMEARLNTPAPSTALTTVGPDGQARPADPLDIWNSEIDRLAHVRESMVRLGMIRDEMPGEKMTPAQAIEMVKVEGAREIQRIRAEADIEREKAASKERLTDIEVKGSRLGNVMGTLEKVFGPVIEKYMGEGLGDMFSGNGAGAGAAAGATAPGADDAFFVCQSCGLRQAVAMEATSATCSRCHHFTLFQSATPPAGGHTGPPHGNGYVDT